MPWRPKYAPLTQFLAAQSRDRVALSFAQIEAILGTALPPSAYTRRWWARGPDLVQTRAWLRAGWRVGSVSLPEQQVTFVRREVSG